MQRLPAQRYGVLAVLIAALSMIGPFSIDAIFPAFERMGAQFGVGADAMQQTVSVYLLAYAAMSLFHGALSDAFGRKPVIVAGMACYGLASLGAFWASSFPMLLAFRAGQGLCAGAGMVVGRAVVRDRLEGADAQRLLARALMIFSIAPAIAPMLGAGLLGVAGWRGIFGFLTGFAWLLALACAWLLAESHPHHARTRFAAAPLLSGYRAIAGDGRFWLLTLAGTVNFSSLFLYIASAPVIVRQHLGLGPGGFPWLFVPVVAGLMGGSALSGRMAGRSSTARTVGTGYALMFTAGLAHLLLAVALPHAMVPWSMLPLALQGVGVQLAFPTITLLLLDRFPQRRGAAASMQAFVSLMINAAVAGVLSPLLAGHMLYLALGMLALLAAGFAAWQRYRRAGSPAARGRDGPASPDAAGGR